MGRRKYPTPVVSRKEEIRGNNDFEAIHYCGDRPWFNLLNAIILKHIQDYQLLAKRNLIIDGKVTSYSWPSYIDVNNCEKLKIIDFYYVNKKMVFDLICWFYTSLPWFIDCVNRISSISKFHLEYSEIMKELNLKENE